jgi:hypothetical protein
MRGRWVHHGEVVLAGFWGRQSAWLSLLQCQLLLTFRPPALLQAQALHPLQ